MRTAQRAGKPTRDRVSDAELLIGTLLMSAIILLTTILAPSFA